MSDCTYRIHLDPEPEGGFTVTVPALKGCVTWGSDYDEAVSMAREAIEAYLAVLVEEGKPIPKESVTPPTDTLVQVKSPAVA